MATLPLTTGFHQDLLVETILRAERVDAGEHDVALTLIAEDGTRLVFTLTAVRAELAGILGVAQRDDPLL